MSTPLSGVLGKVYKDGVEIADVRGWTYSPANDIKTYRSSGTVTDGKSHQGTVAGGYSWEVSFSMYTPDGSLNIPLVVGELFVFKGETTTGKSVEGQCRVSAIEFEVDIEGVEIMGAEVSATGHLADTRTG